MIINTEKVNGLKAGLSLRNSTWRQINLMEWAWELHQAHHRIIMEMSQESGLHLTSVVLSGMCQMNNSLNFEGVMDQAVTGCVNRLGSEIPIDDNTARGVMIAGYPALMTSFLGNELPQLILLAWAGVGCRTYLIKE